MRRDGVTWGDVPNDESQLAHANSSMTCYACHTSWTPNCFGCHLSMTANQKRPMLHNEGLTTRNWTSYNFQVLRDDGYMLGRGRHGHRTSHCARAVFLRHSGKFAERQSRVVVQHAANRFDRRFQRPGVFHICAAHGARARNQAMHAIATCPPRATTMPGCPCFFCRAPIS